VPAFVWEDFGIRIEPETVIYTEQLVAELYWYLFDMAEDTGGRFLSLPDEIGLNIDLGGPPDFDSLGTADDFFVGLLQSWSNELAGCDPDMPEYMYFIVSEHGLWVLYDSLNDVVQDYGILIRDTEDSVYYSVTQDGEFMTLASGDVVPIISSIYGALTWVEE